jgi:23S rRNA (guanosine2251-2'-O)-methyltransferase
LRKLSLKELGRVDVDTFRQQSKTPIVLVLDNIRSAMNVGSAFRTADAFALEKIYLCGITATPPHREILKTAIGATDSMDWESGDLIPVLRKLKEDGYLLAAVEQTDASIALQDFTPPSGQPIAFIFGNEVKGVSDEALVLADLALEIPQFGTKHSLNISVCLGIVVWETFKKYSGFT